MKRTVAVVNHKGEFRVVKDYDKKVNPYTVTYHWRELSEYGLRKRQKKLASYADVVSCMCCVTDWIRRVGE